MTRADIRIGVMYVTLAPEHPLVGAVAYEEQIEELENCVASTSTQSDLDRINYTIKNKVRIKVICFYFI